jgi:hypothetical protein
MGRVRFYNPEKDKYISLRVEADGVYLNGQKMSQRKEKKKVPPKQKNKVNQSETSIQFAARNTDTDLLAKILTVLNDFEQTCVLDASGMVSIKPAYKSSGYQIGVYYRETWSNFSGGSILEALVNYFHETLAEESTPPTPFKRGKDVGTQRPL